LLKSEILCTIFITTTAGNLRIFRKIKMSTRIIPSTRVTFFDLAAYVTLGAVAAVGIFEIPYLLYRWLAMGMLILVGILISRTVTTDDSLDPRQTQLSLALQTLMVSGMLAFTPGSSVFVILFYVLSVEAMLTNSFRVGLLWLGVFGLVSALNFIYANGWPAGLGDLLPMIAGYFFFGVVANSLYRAAQAQRASQKLLLELNQANQQLRENARQVEKLAVVEERNRLAREMHDTVGHRLTVAAVQLEGAQRLIPNNPERATQIVGTVREQVREALNELRQTVARLREPLEADLELLPSIHSLAESFTEATGLVVHLTLPARIPEITGPFHQALYRTTQEALTNIQRHAQASQAWLHLELADNSLILSISDDGRGYPEAEPTAGFGLIGLRERAGLLGGSLTLGSRPEGGAQLTLTLPMQTEVESA
jgi:signal transduction histidine kinase